MLHRHRPATSLLAAAIAVVVTLGCADSATSPRPAAPLAASWSKSATEGASTPTDQHVFVMNGNAIPSDFAAAVATVGGELLRSHDEIGVAVVKGLSDESADELARGRGKVERDVLRQWVPTLEELQGSVYEVEAPVDATFTTESPLTAAFLPIQWNMFQVHAPEAWANRTGSRNVRVAILDTGLDPDHIDQAGVIDVANSVAFTPSLSGPPDWADDQFHGTHVGGLVTTNNIGTAGIAPNVTLIAIKVLNAAGAGTFGDVIAGLIWAGNVRADVANLSVGGMFPKSGAGQLVAALNRAVNYANSQDVLVVSAAGNDLADLQHNQNLMQIPCESGTGMCVSSTGPMDMTSSFSNYGVSAIHVAAPGGEYGPPETHFVLGPCSSRSVIPGLVGCRSRTRYLFVIGTSQAAPHVSGLAAFLDSQYGGSLNPAQLQARLEQCSDDIGKSGTDEFYGKGRINALKTVNETGCNNSSP